MDTWRINYSNLDVKIVKADYFEFDVMSGCLTFYRKKKSFWSTKTQIIFVTRRMYESIELVEKI